MAIQGGIDQDVLMLPSSKSLLMTQRDFITWLLQKHGKATTYFMHKNWNAYKQFVMGFRKPCSYAGFRRAIWKMKSDGFLIALPKSSPRNRKEELFGTTYYKLRG